MHLKTKGISALVPLWDKPQGPLLWKITRPALITAGDAGPGKPEYSAKCIYPLSRSRAFHIHMSTYSSHPNISSGAKVPCVCLLPTAYNCGAFLRLLSPFLRPCSEKQHLLGTTWSALYMSHVVTYSSTQRHEVNSESFILQKLMFMEIKYYACGHTCSLFLLSM